MKLLVVRFSAFGDVAMTIPVIDSVARQYPDVQITVLTQPFVQPLFTNLPSNVTFRGVKLASYKGLGGLYRLYKELKAEGYDAVADLHSVLRTQVIRTLFQLGGTKIASIDKGRKEKKALTRWEKKVFKPLKSSFERYAEVFSKLGLPVKVQFTSIYKDQIKPAIHEVETLLSLPPKNESDRWIGIAPFAAHAGKLLPEATTLKLIELLSRQPNTSIFLFGGKGEKEKLEEWASKYSHTYSVAGILGLEKELALLSHLNALVAMDSANMHLASLVGTRVISVWGATHPYAGFMGWNQQVTDAVQVELSCRPCSVFGNKPCQRGDYACLVGITAEMIEEKIRKSFLETHH
ncbi:MAG: glycosyltransferase family 9 protein [Phocaeicola sp.]